MEIQIVRAYTSPGLGNRKLLNLCLRHAVGTLSTYRKKPIKWNTISKASSFDDFFSTAFSCNSPRDCASTRPKILASHYPEPKLSTHHPFGRRDRASWNRKRADLGPATPGNPNKPDPFTPQTRTDAFDPLGNTQTPDQLPRPTLSLCKAAPSKKGSARLPNRLRDSPHRSSITTAPNNWPENPNRQ
ncbi:hypothetical protein CROQUDRAFT_109740 [Cronartium quercuum f. sp. fusiforme G11]|uniref:Uncharacterized protein n=1 Tax=Cronartium quercuum f. sp. fusiforme G11 TaxID=708437 RepID=A0A9P6T8I4_9BASI|nr:hypothetical protein CROQUDRAFT_109740 [Cronartium quercuum f. sp. fusiforme G11]